MYMQHYSSNLHMYSPATISPEVLDFCASIMAFFNIQFICTTQLLLYVGATSSTALEILQRLVAREQFESWCTFQTEKSRNDPERCFSSRQQDLAATSGRSNWASDKLWSPVQSRGSLTGWAGVWWASVSPRSSGALQANQPPRRGSRSAFTPALHQRAGRGGNHQPISMCCYFTPPAFHLRRRLWLSNQPLALLTSKALHGVKGGWWVQSNKVWQKR